MTQHPLRIAIDGPAASGKGTLAKRVAKHLGLAHLDTGRIYRAVGHQLLQEGEDPHNTAKATAAAKALQISAIDSPDLYCEGVGNAASIVSAIPEVREILLKFQQDFAAQPNGAVLDGRDIGTVICPDADFKFFITADIEARAKRRYKQLQNTSNCAIYESVLQDLERRDERDRKRQAAPMRPADDAIVIDTTHMNANEVFATVLKNINSSS